MYIQEPRYTLVCDNCNTKWNLYRTAEIDSKINTMHCNFCASCQIGKNIQDYKEHTGDDKYDIQPEIIKDDNQLDLFKKA